MFPARMSLDASPKASGPDTVSPVAVRARELYEQQRVVAVRQVHRSFVVLMGCQYAAALLGALVFTSPESLGFTPALVLGALYASVPVFMALRYPDLTVTRHVIAAGQMLVSSLLIHVTGGRLETHFHVFGSLAFLAFYRDWRVLVTASAMISLDHLVRGLFWPGSVFGIATVDHWRWLEHTGWIVFEVAFLILAVRQNQETLWRLMEGRAELEGARDTAEQASHAKDEFLAVLSHELRTPLTPSLMTLSTLAEDESLPAEAREEIELVRRNVELEARLIDDLLDLTRIARGKLELSQTNVDLHTLLTQILQTSRMEFEEKGLTVERSLKAKHHWIYGDSARLQQVFWNLLRNAVKFTPRGGKIIVSTEDAHDRIKIDFSDTGVGIAADVLPKIFQRFEQGGAQVTRQFGGLGLGLSICRAIVDLHRGAIRAESRGPGWGATFTVVLASRGGAPATAKLGSLTQKLRLSGKLPNRVLLVDDHADTRETIRKLLTRTGYDVTVAGSLETALQKAGEASYDILLSDIGLPDGSGWDLMAAVRGRMPGIAFSGYGMEEDVRKSHEAGFSAHLTKPVDFPKLKEAMTQALSKPQPAAV